MSELVELLNQIHELDPTVLPALIAFRVPCNQALANHPRVQVLGTNKGEEMTYELGILGLLNGLIENSKTGGFIAANYNNENQLTHFGKVVI